MRRYQKLRDPDEPKGTFAERLWMLLGLCYSAMAYYFFVYLGERNVIVERGSTNRAYPGPGLHHMKLLRTCLYVGWISVAVIAVLLLAAPRWAAERFHAPLYLLPIAMVALLILTGAYHVGRFLKRPDVKL